MLRVKETYQTPTAAVQPEASYDFFPIGPSARVGYRGGSNDVPVDAFNYEAMHPINKPDPLQVDGGCKSTSDEKTCGPDGGGLGDRKGSDIGRTAAVLSGLLRLGTSSSSLR